MTREAPMEELIARLEKATGPDRELDAEISGAIMLWLTPEEEPPAYTASLDAALTLVPEGMDWEVCNLRSNGHLNGFVMRENPDNPDEYISRMGSHQAAAIALCIAALRARLP